jgi:hypothetical protein
VSIPSDNGDAVAAIREQFDRAVAVAPEASVALYSLGSADIVDRATTEIVLLRPDAAVLDVGCGIGRLERFLAPQVGAITAIDVSAAMIEEARRRCRDLGMSPSSNAAGVISPNSATGLLIWCSRSTRFRICSPRVPRTPLNTCEMPPGFIGLAGLPSFSIFRTAVMRRPIAATSSGWPAPTGCRRAGTRDFILWDGLTFLLTLPARRE